MNKPYVSDFFPQYDNRFIGHRIIDGFPVFTAGKETAWSDKIGGTKSQHMPLAKDVAGVEDDLIRLLQHIPGTKEAKQSCFASRSIRVPRTNYEGMWGALASRLGRGGAASVVFDLLLYQSSVGCR